MKEKLINIAAENLELIDIFQIGLQTEVTEKHSFSSLINFDCDLRFRYAPIKRYVSEHTVENESEAIERLTVILSCEAILIKEDDDDDDPEILLRYEATYAVEYHILNSENLPPETLDHFGFYNTPFHVWPFWREDLSSVIKKAGLCAGLLPMYKAWQIQGEPETILSETKEEV